MDASQTIPQRPSFFPPRGWFGQVASQTLPYEELQEVRQRLTEVSPNLTRYGDLEEANFFAQAETLAKVRGDC